MDISALRETHDRLLSNLGKVYKRKSVSISKGKIVTGIVGSRGVGKTTFLLDHIRNNYGVGNKKALYVSADNIYFSENSLVGLTRQFVNIDGGELLCIDEIHRYENWAQELKNIFDSYPDLQIIFSGSSIINIIEQKYDLSRRVILKYFPGLSFREWLGFTQSIELAKLTLDEITTVNAIPAQITEIKGLIGLFQQYMKTGYYPLRASVETDEEFYSALMAAVEKIIFNDIATYFSLKTHTLGVFKKILYFVTSTPPGKINPSALASSLGKHHQDVANYLDMMRSSSLLRYLLIDKQGHVLIRNAEKIFLDNTNIAYAISDNTGKDVNIGTIRENFVINQLQNAGYKTFYSKQGDVNVDDYTFEIGGANKDASQLQGVDNSFVLRDDVVYKQGRFIPLYAMGFMYQLNTERMNNR